MSDITTLMMGAAGAGGGGAETDEYFNQTTLLLHGDGTNGAQNNTFLDSSSNNFTITRNGNVTQGSFSPFSRSSGNLVNAPYDPAVHGGSGYFDGSGDYLTAADNAALDLGTDNFTIHAWIYPTWSSPGSNEPIVAKGNSSATGTWQLDVQSTSVLRFAWNSGSSFSSTGTISPNQWTHIAVVREGTGTDETKIYINGVNDGTGTVSQNLTDGGLLKISRNRDNSTIFDGYISSLAIVRSAIWTANFTPPTAPPTAITDTELLLNFTNAGIFDNTGKNNLETVGNAQIDTATKKYGTGSMEFDGTGDYLSIFNSPVLDLGTGNFTIEGWIYPNDLNVVFCSGGSSVNERFDFSYVNSTGLRFFVDSSVGNVDIDFPDISVNAWTHVAIVRDGNDLEVFYNGVSQGSTTTGGFSMSGMATAFLVGVRGWSGSYQEDINGYIDDLRITKGVARYTANFTPPDAPFLDQ